MFRVLHADLDSCLESVAILGIIHGAAEVTERSTMVVTEHICHVLWQRKPPPWGRFRTPRRERLLVDITIMSMLAEPSAIASVNGYIFLYQVIYTVNKPFFDLLWPFAIHTSVSLIIEWVFMSISLAIATYCQNVAVMAVWRSQWRSSDC